MFRQPRSHHRTLSILSALALSLILPLAHASVVPTTPFGLEIEWKRTFGSGYSALVVAGELGLASYSDAQNDYLAAFDLKTGEEKWRYTVGPLYKGHDGSDDGPIATPVVDGQSAYGLDPHGRFFAVRVADGTELWARTLELEKEAVPPRYGYSTSPLVAADALIVQTGRKGGGAVSGYDPRTGKLMWSVGDDSVSYQSPILASVGGREQVVASTDHHLMGLHPKTGEILWQHRHTAENGGGIARPVALGDGRFLLQLEEKAVAFKVSAHGATYTVEEQWRSNAFGNTFAEPVLHQGYLYGLTGQFLTCLDAVTGVQMWKSRPPGGRSLALVDGHLAVVSNQGELVIAAATPKGYEEKARVKAFERGPLTAPTVAGGRFLLRDLKEVASIRPTAAAASPLAKSSGPDLSKVGGELGAVLRKVSSASAAESKALLDGYFAGKVVLPVTEADGTTHFLYRGEAPDAAVSGNFLGFDEELALTRVGSSDLFLYTAKLDPAACYDYRLRINFGESLPDANNPHQVASSQGIPGSELRQPGWKHPAPLAEPGGSRGKVETHSFKNAAGAERQVQVYLPPGYQQGSTRYPLLVLNNGDQTLNFGLLAHTLDNLIGKSVAPVVVAFVPRLGPENGFDRVPAYVQMLKDELVPFLEKTYRLDGRREARAVGGVGRGSYHATYAAFLAPEVFGGLAAQSFFWAGGAEDPLAKLIGESKQAPTRVFVERLRSDLNIPQANINSAADAGKLIELLKSKGGSVTANEAAGPPGWCAWRANADQMLATLFPFKG